MDTFILVCKIIGLVYCAVAARDVYLCLTLTPAEKRSRYRAQVRKERKDKKQAERDERKRIKRGEGDSFPMYPPDYD